MARETIDEMFGEYRIARSFLDIKAFIDLYPDVTKRQLEQLAARYDQWLQRLDTAQRCGYILVLYRSI